MGTEENLEQGMLFGTILIHRFELKMILRNRIKYFVLRNLTTYCQNVIIIT